MKNAKEILIYQAKYTMHNIENMNYDAIINSVIMTFTNEADIKFLLTFFTLYKSVQ